jgi:dihydroorotate dehydrogenase electron transfer subunit
MNKRKVGIAKVIENNPINSSYFTLILRLQGINYIKPGQFVNLKIDNLSLQHKTQPVFDQAEFTDLNIKKPFLMRPFSVGRILKIEKNFLDAEFLIKEVGIGSFILHQIEKGTYLNFLGPLGCEFKINKKNKHAILIAGGTGLAPLMALASTLSNLQIKTYLLIGAINKDNLPIHAIKKTGKLESLIPDCDTVIPEMESEYCFTGVSTDDGSLGYKGFVTDLAEKLINTIQIEKKEDITLYSCGPMPMMKAAQNHAKSHSLHHQVSLERHMACGLGVCLSCVNKIKKGNKWEHISICSEGPVFDADEVIFDE